MALKLRRKHERWLHRPPWKDCTLHFYLWMDTISNTINIDILWTSSSSTVQWSNINSIYPHSTCFGVVWARVSDHSRADWPTPASTTSRLEISVEMDIRFQPPPDIGNCPPLGRESLHVTEAGEYSSIATPASAMATLQVAWRLGCSDKTSVPA